LYYLASVEEVRHLIKSGVAMAIGPKKRLDGCILYTGPVRPHAGTKYTHCHEVSETWTGSDGIEHQRHPLDANVRGVYTLKRLSNLDRSLFRAVERSCLSNA